MLHFTRHYKDTLQDKIDGFDAISFQVFWSMCANNDFNIKIFDKVFT